MQVKGIKMRKLTYLLFVLVFQVLPIQSQPSQHASSTDLLQMLKNFNSNNSEITIHLDSLIEMNYYKHIHYNRKDPGAKGYQIRIYSGSGQRAKENAEKARSLFLSKYENIGAYLVYDTPDYKVYVGDCRTPSDVLKLILRVKVEFPNAFPVSRRINVSYD